MQVPPCAVGTDGYERAARGECERHKLHLKARPFNLRRCLSGVSALICVDVRHVMHGVACCYDSSGDV